MMGFAALTSCVSVMETLVANCMEIFHKSRKHMCLAIGGYSLVTAVIICLGYNILFFDIKLPTGNGAQLLDVVDYISNNFLMPFISLLTSILIGWVDRNGLWRRSRRTTSLSRVQGFTAS